MRGIKITHPWWMQDASHFIDPNKNKLFCFTYCYCLSLSNEIPQWKNPKNKICKTGYKSSEHLSNSYNSPYANA